MRAPSIGIGLGLKGGGAGGGGGGASYWDIALAKSPAFLWKFNETSDTGAADSSGNDRHGTFQGTPDFDQESIIPSLEDGSIGLDGNNEQASIAYDASWMPLTDEFTFVFAYYPRSFASQKDIVGWGAAWQLWQETSGKVTFYINSGGYVSIESTTALSLTTAYHVVLRKTGGATDKYSIWINGVKDKEGSLDGNVFNGSAAIYVGQSANSRYINARMQGPMYWLTALSDEDIADLYASYTG